MGNDKQYVVQFVDGLFLAIGPRIRQGEFREYSSDTRKWMAEAGQCDIFYRDMFSGEYLATKQIEGVYVGSLKEMVSALKGERRLLNKKKSDVTKALRALRHEGVYSFLKILRR